MHLICAARPRKYVYMYYQDRASSQLAVLITCQLHVMICIAIFCTARYGQGGLQLGDNRPYRLFPERPVPRNQQRLCTPQLAQRSREPSSPVQQCQELHHCCEPSKWLILSYGGSDTEDNNMISPPPPPFLTRRDHPLGSGCSPATR